MISACESGDKKAAATNSGTKNSPAKSAIFNSVDNAGDSMGSHHSNISDTANFTSIEWIDKINQNLPKIKEGEVIEVTYRFKNTGDKPLIVQNVYASCGCTVPEKPEEPISPGKEGLIKAKFDSHGKSGTNTKTLTVLANTSSDKILTFTVDVEQ